MVSLGLLKIKEVLLFRALNDPFFMLIEVYEMLMKIAVGFLFFIAFPFFSYAQKVDSLATKQADTTWQVGGDINVNFSQVSLSNWSGGGQSSISLGNILNLHANYNNGRTIWNNKLQAAYGLIRQGKGKDQPVRKSDDLLFLETQYGRRFSSKLFASVLVNFRTQFYKGEELEEQPDGTKVNKLVSEFMSPAYLQAALGITYKEKKILNFTLSPFTSKNTISLNDRLAPLFNIPEGENIKSEVGASFNGNFKKEIIKNIRVETNLNLFSNYQKFKNVDVNWTTNIVLKVNKFVTSSITTQLIYDDDIDVPRDNKPTPGPATQFKSAINVGFAYSF